MTYSVIDNIIGGKIFIFIFETLKVHTFIEPVFGTCTYILEGCNKLMIIDTFHTLAANYALIDYATSLNKPISSVILSNSHPAHYAGLYLYEQSVPIYALQSTINRMKEEGQTFPLVTFLKDQLVKKLRYPDNEIIHETSLVFDNIKLEFMAVGTKLLIWIPEYKLIFGQDIFFNNYHAYIPSTIDKLNKWIKVLNNFYVYANPSIIFSGHGAPIVCAKNSHLQYYKEMINYLTFVHNLLSTKDPKLTKDQYVKILTQQYNNYCGIDIVEYYLNEYFTTV